MELADISTAFSSKPWWKLDIKDWLHKQWCFLLACFVHCMQDSKVKASNEAAKAIESETGPETME